MAEQNSSQGGRPTTFAEKRATIEAFSWCPALMISVFIRRRLGFRALKPVWLETMGWILLFLAYAFPAQAAPFPPALMLFAIAMVGMGHWERFKRWREICNGQRWHTYSTGVSYLERLQLPPFFFANRRIYRWLDPLLCLLLAIPAFLLSHLFGAVIVICGACLAITENAFWERTLAQNLDILDGLLAGEVQVEVAKFFQQGPTGGDAGGRILTLDQTSGIPTGLAPDIHRQIELQKAKQGTLGADDLSEASILNRGA
jgi:hypothetical protein